MVQSYIATLMVQSYIIFLIKRHIITQYCSFCAIITYFCSEIHDILL